MNKLFEWWAAKPNCVTEIVLCQPILMFYFALQLCFESLLWHVLWGYAYAVFSERISEKMTGSAGKAEVLFLRGEFAEDESDGTVVRLSGIGGDDRVGWSGPRG